MDEKQIWYNINLKPNKFYNGESSEATHRASVPVNGRWVTVALIRQGEGDVLKLSISRDGLKAHIENQKKFAEMKKQQPVKPIAPKPFNQQEYEETINPDDLPF